MKPKLTLISSFSNPKRVLQEVERLKRTYDVEIVLPTQEHFDRMLKTMGASNACSGTEMSKTLRLKKSLNMEMYFRAIKESDIVHVFNLKNGKEYYGFNTLIEIGVAHALGKKITCFISPTVPEIKSLVSEVLIETEYLSKLCSIEE